MGKILNSIKLLIKFYKKYIRKLRKKRLDLETGTLNQLNDNLKEINDDLKKIIEIIEIIHFNYEKIKNKRNKNPLEYNELEYNFLKFEENIRKQQMIKKRLEKRRKILQNLKNGKNSFLYINNRSLINLFSYILFLFSLVNLSLYLKNNNLYLSLFLILISFFINISYFVSQILSLKLPLFYSKKWKIKIYHNINIKGTFSALLLFIIGIFLFYINNDIKKQTLIENITWKEIFSIFLFLFSSIYILIDYYYHEFLEIEKQSIIDKLIIKEKNKLEILKIINSILGVVRFLLVGVSMIFVNPVKKFLFDLISNQITTENFNKLIPFNNPLYLAMVLFIVSFIFSFYIKIFKNLKIIEKAILKYWNENKIE